MQGTNFTKNSGDSGVVGQIIEADTGWSHPDYVKINKYGDTYLLRSDYPELSAVVADEEWTTIADGSTDAPMALSGNGRYFAVYEATPSGGYPAGVQIYVRVNKTIWKHQGTIEATPIDRHAIAMDYHGRKMIIGARGTGVGGTVYLCKRVQTHWGIIKTKAYGTGYAAGSAVAMSPTGVYAGVTMRGFNSNYGGVEFLYIDEDLLTVSSTINAPTLQTNSLFGHALAIPHDDDLIYISHKDYTGGSNAQGRVYCFQSTTLRYTFDDPSPINSGQFGASLAVARTTTDEAVDEHIVVIGSDGANDVHVFRGYSTTYTLDQTINLSAIGLAVATTHNGGTIYAGRTSYGVREYQFVDGAWTFMKEYTSTTGSFKYDTLAVSADGSVIATDGNTDGTYLCYTGGARHKDYIKIGAYAPESGKTGFIKVK